jgi:hypothetical protein
MNQDMLICQGQSDFMHEVSEKWISANFALTEFLDVRLRRHPKEVESPAEVGVQEVVQTLVVGREEPL